MRLEAGNPRIVISNCSGQIQSHINGQREAIVQTGTYSSARLRGTDSTSQGDGAGRGGGQGAGGD